MKNRLLLLIITSCFISCETTINDTKNESKHIIGKEFNEDGEPLDIISGDVGLTDIWINYIDAHNQKNLDKIFEIDDEDIEVFRADGTVGRGIENHNEYLRKWFESSNPNWKVIWMVTNSVEKKDGTTEHWLTTGNEFSDEIDGEKIFMNVIADVNFVNGKIKRINIHNREKEKTK